MPKKREARARPTAARRQRRRVLRLGISAVTAVVLIGFGGWGLSSNAPARLAAKAGEAADWAMISAGLTVREVKLTGRTWANQSDIVAALGLYADQTIFDIDLKGARARLEAMGWIESARVSRRLPSTLEVHIVEREPFALWQVRRRLVLIDRAGETILRKGLGRFTYLPVVVGEDAPDFAAELIDTLSGQPELLERVDAATRVGLRRWNLRFDNGVDVYLPEDGVAEAWRRLGALQDEQGILDREVAVIDLRLTDRLVVRMTPRVAARMREPGEDT
ncbi:MAG: FtsQ-type POTRA domain-containing protein [Proteobacteria bacterium]|nr:FtsQ-type POTRA domain-containing protein [Pseudomonadota bacterium]